LSTLPVIAALGAGRMGRGIAHAFAYAGHEVLLIDAKVRSTADAERLGSEALAEIDANLKTVAELGAFDDRERAAILARIRFVPRGAAPDALARADFLFEGVPEVIEAKREALAFACQNLCPETIVASTTSTFLVTALASLVARPAQFLNAHWLNPAYIIPLVELSPHETTSPEATARLKSLLEAIGKVPVECKASPGYIVPRLQALVMNEAARMVEQGVASPEDIDRACRYGFGFRYANMGLVEFIDFGGNDILYYASRYLAEALADPRFAPPEIVVRHMNEGANGLRDGKGFYDWASVDAAAYRREALSRLVGMLRYSGHLRAPGSALAADTMGSK
jgi:3-hydroxybutyryl-CoA dehydrogenase